MRAVVDTSAVFRKLFGEQGALKEWGRIDDAFASRILLVELGRAVDRVRLAGKIDDDQVVSIHQEARKLLASATIVSLTPRILRRAAAAFPTVVGTLDALHLATALELARDDPGSWVLATHDEQLARAARASGLEVVGA